METEIGGIDVGKKNYLFTSESVSEGHQDKICDRISDAIVDKYLAADPLSRAAVETLCATALIVLSGSVRVPCSISHQSCCSAPWSSP